MYVVYIVVALIVVQVAHAGYCHRPNLDCSGNDIRSFAGYETACKIACDRDVNCKSIQVFHGKCWLKRAACQNHELRPLIHGDDFVKYDGQCDHSIYVRPMNKYCHRDLTNCIGYDLVHVQGTSGARQCTSLCDFREDCSSIQFMEDGQCWLKSHACSNDELSPLYTGNDYVKVDMWDETCTEYERPLQHYCHRAGVNCVGHDIHYLNWVKTAKECQRLCSWNKDCKSIQFADNNRCWLKRHACTNSELSAGYNDFVKVPVGSSCYDFDMIRAYRYCERPGKNCVGYDILLTNSTTLKYCQDLCSYKDECKSIQYVGTSCWLKRHACQTSQLQAWQPGRDRVKIPRGSECKAELAKLA